jgi:hypothetical protein
MSCFRCQRKRVGYILLNCFFFFHLIVGILEEKKQRLPWLRAVNYINLLFLQIRQRRSVRIDSGLFGHEKFDQILNDSLSQLTLNGFICFDVYLCFKVIIRPWCFTLLVPVSLLLSYSLLACTSPNVYVHVLTTFLSDWWAVFCAVNWLTFSFDLYCRKS